MEQNTSRRGEQFLQKNKRWKRWQKVVTAMACVVVFCTTYALILPAITLEQKVYCGQEEHEAHGSECYQVESVLTCNKAETDGHEHSDACYEIKDQLVCGKDEGGGHTHSDDCYKNESRLTCGREESAGHHHGEGCYDEDGNLICGRSESEGHSHSSDCYTTEGILVCGQEEHSGHTHGSECYESEKTLVCGKKEEKAHHHSDACYEKKETLICTRTIHKHTDACASNPDADVEDRSKWEESVKDVKLTTVWADDMIAIARSQLGYSESTSNYIIDENGNKKGYSKYGDWYGNAYGDWCAMYVSFCIHYAGIPTNESDAVMDENGRKIYVPISAGCQNWIELMNREETPYYYAIDDENSYTLLNDSTGFEPQAGNLIFFNWDSQPDADHVGIVVAVERNKKDEITEIKTIEGNSSNKVKYNTYSPDNKNIMGYAVLPVNPNEITEEESTAIDESDAAEEAAVIGESDAAEEAAVIGESEVAEKAVAAESEAETSLAAEDSEETSEETESEGTAEFENVEESVSIEESEAEAIADDQHLTRTYDGADFHITLTYGADAGIPANAEVKVRELVGAEYDQACQEAIEAMGIVEISFARFFDITFLVNGREIEPDGSVEVQIIYDEPLEVGANEVGKAVHFADEGTEVLDMQVENHAEGSVLTFEQESFSTTGTVYGIAPLAEDGDDGIALLADSDSWSAAPPVGNVTGIVVSAPVVGEWYMLYGYNSSGTSYVLPESWPNRGSLNSYATSPCPTLSTASNTLGGSVKYTGSLDVVWQYVGDGGFVNRYGYYMYMTTTRSGYYNYTYSTSFSVTKTPSASQLPLKYSWESKAFYTSPSNTYSYGKYNILMINSSGYSDHGDASDTLVAPSSFGSNRLNHYLAQVTGLDSTDGGHSNHPITSVTGSVTLNKPVLYNIDATGTTMSGLANVVYTITNTSNGESISVTSESQISVELPSLAAGTYTIEQTSVPSGYVVTPQKREFTIDSNGQGQPGLFYLYKEGEFEADKTGQVIDYINRVYQIEINAKSGRYSYTVPPINLLMVVDQSNSMLFPQTLTPVSGATVRLYRSGSGENKTNDARLLELVSSGKLKKNTTYYLVTDENGDTATSTVYAIFWDGSGWCYQDAAYYSKAYRHWELGDETNVIENSGHVQYASSAEEYDSSKHGGSISNQLKDKFEKDLGTSGNNYRDYQLYTGSEYNRLHELQQAVVALAGLVGSLNSQSTMLIETFAKDVYSCDKYQLNNSGIIQIYNRVNQITTRGGTRQDLALQHIDGAYTTGDIDSSAKNTSAYHNGAAKHSHLDSSRDDYVILITDGAPNVTSVGGTNSIQAVVNVASTLKSHMSGNDKLITIGLGAGNVGGSMLPNSASSPSSTYYRRVEESGALTTYFLDLFLKELASHKTAVASEADIVDIVSDSFYITDQNGNALSPGDRINLTGEPDSSGPGLICYDAENNEWYVKWDDQTLGTGGSSTTTDTAWKGHVYLKAKEDFIGGNTIDTNKSAKVTLNNEDHTSAGDGISLPTPTVNVRLLPMEGFESEETVFLGDEITDIREKLQTLLEKTVVEKIRSGTGNQLNYKEGATEENGCYSDHFTIPYAIRDLTENEWNQLMSGGTIRIDYTYDDASSHGAVGYFSFTLTKEAVEGETSSYGDHTTDVNGVDVEKYTLTVTYTAYRQGESDTQGKSRGENVHNGSQGPGTEVGRGSDIPNGAGSESVEEIHHVHVIDGEIFLTKVIDQSLVSNQDQYFEFTLCQKDTNTVIRTVTVKVKAEETTGTIVIDNLPRNQYIVKETEDSAFVVQQVRVVAGDTICIYEEEMPSLEFDIGTNAESNGVNPDNNVIIYNETSPDYERSVWVDEDRYVYSKPFDTPNAGGSSGSGSDSGSGSGSDSGSGSESGSGSGSGSSGTHTETVTEIKTRYAWPSGTIISTSTSDGHYVRLSSSQDQLDASHTSYGILTEVSSDNWQIEWNTWTSHEETVTTGSGSDSYEPVTVTCYGNRDPDFSAYTTGDYYLYDQSQYKQIRAIEGNAYSLSVTFADGSHNYNVSCTSSNYDHSLSTNVTTFTFYRKAAASGTTTQTVWSKSTNTVNADTSMIPTETYEVVTEIEVPNEPDPQPDPSSGQDEDDSDADITVTSSKLSYGHGVITNTSAGYTADIPVRKMWSDGEEHSDDDVYVVLCDKNGQTVTDADGHAKMLKLTAANNWQDSFTIQVPTRDYDPIGEGYRIREVKDIRTNEFLDSFTATLVNDQNDETVYHVQVAQHGDTIAINNKGYTVNYRNTATRLVVINARAYELPNTGGIGTILYTSGGWVLIFISLLSGIYLRRKRERRSM